MEKKTVLIIIYQIIRIKLRHVFNNEDKSLSQQFYESFFLMFAMSNYRTYVQFSKKLKLKKERSK